jgi:hypothetical protein
VRGHTVVGELEVQEGTKHATLRGPRVEDQCGGGVVTYPHHLGAARQEVQDSVAQGGVQSQGPELSDELGGLYGVEHRAVVYEQHSHIGVPLVQEGKCSVECDRDCVIYESIYLWYVVYL